MARDCMEVWNLEPWCLVGLNGEFHSSPCLPHGEEPLVPTGWKAEWAPELV